MKHILILIFLCFIFSCDDDDYSRITMVGIENERVVPDTAENMESVQIKIKASAGSLCWSDLYVELRELDTFEYSIKAFGTFTCHKGGCACPDMMVYKDTIIYFQPTQEGLYLFSISETKNKVDIDTMIVQ
jgi:hypothetical protein